MGSEKSGAWYIAYFPHSLVFGMFSVLIPLYFVDTLKGSLLDLGLMTFASTLLGILASIYFDKLPDKFGRTKPFILASFLSTGALLLFLSDAKSVFTFQMLYVLVTIADSLHPTSTNVLIAETYHKKSWGAAFARYNFVAGVAQAVGLVVCSLFIANVGYRNMIFISSPLVLLSFALALLLLRDPPIYVEKWLSKLESPIDEVNSLTFQLDARTPKIRERPKMIFAGLGFMAFSFSATCCFTSLPVYLTQNASISSSMVFAIFFVRSIAGTMSYIPVGKWISGRGKTAVRIASMLRIALALLLPTIAMVPMFYSPFLAVIILSLFSFSWSLFFCWKKYGYYGVRFK